MNSKIDLGKTYKILVQYDKYILSNFNKKEISDDEYFKYGIYSEIVTNALSIVINLLYDNEYSVGLDNNCRAIIEALLIMELDKSGNIKAENKQLYRLSYALIERDNLRNTNITGVKNSKRAGNIDSDLDKFYELACKHFKCNKDVLLHCKSINDPYFCLTNKLGESTNLIDIAKRNGVALPSNDYRYSYFSFMIHPRFEIEKDIEDANMKFRHNYIVQTLQDVLDFIDENPLKKKTESENYEDSREVDLDFFSSSKDDKVVPIKDIFRQHPEFDLMIKDISAVFDSLLRVVNTSIDFFLPFFLTKMKALFVDMLYCLFLGFNEMVINKAKSYIEMFALLIRILSIKDRREREYRTLGFVLGSRIQINSILKKSKNSFHIKIDKDDYDFLYGGFYKENYELSDISKFKEGLKRKNLYAFSKDPLSYTKLVKKSLRRDSIDTFYSIMTLYEISLDVEHASGYSFNGSPYLFEYYSNDTMSAFSSIVYNVVASIDTGSSNENRQLFDYCYGLTQYFIEIFEAKKIEVALKYGITFDNSKKGI